MSVKSKILSTLNITVFLKRSLAFLMSAVMFVLSFLPYTLEAYAAGRQNVVSILSVSDISDCSDNEVQIKLSLNKVQYYKSYELQYSADKNFKIGVNTVRGTKKNVTLDDGFAPYYTYYFRVRSVYVVPGKGKTSAQKQANAKTYYSSWSKATSLQLEYYCVDSGAYDASVQAKAVIASLGITSDMPDAQKVALVQNWINHNWYYVKDNYYSSYDIYNHLFYVKGGACLQFANHFAVFMKELGIPCKVINRAKKLGAKSDHTFNLIKIDGYWWNYDCEAYGEKTDITLHNQLDYDDESIYHYVYTGEASDLTYSDNYRESSVATGLYSDSQKVWNSCTPHAGDAMVKSMNKQNEAYIYELISD